jgi:DNA-binding MurR/RpiR family transcriptional regulator
LEAHRQAPDSYEHLREQVLTRHDQLSRQLQRIGRFSIENPDMVALETVTSVARKADVQPSAIVRFAKAFGYDGFSSMQQVFRQNLITSQGSYRDRIRSLSEPGTGEPSNVLTDFVRAAISSLEQLQASSAEQKLEDAVAVLSDARDIYLLGYRRAFAVAQYLDYALSRLERRCILADGAGGMLDQQLAHCDKSDAVIAISFTPYTEAVIEQANRLARAGVRVVAITDSPLSPLAGASSVAFDIHEGDTAFRSLVAPMCLAQTLVVSLGQELSKREKQNAKAGKGAPD